ncbi:MAG: ABC transporter ATP-binding protein [Eubacterium sp.]
MVLFKTEDLSFTYPTADKKALNDVSLEINAGELVLLMGKTGSGKSTLLRMLKKELSPAGTVQGKVINNSRATAFVQQNPDTSFVSQRVRGELAFALENQSINNDIIAIKIGETASFFNLTQMLDSDVNTLSGGEKATVAVAAAMICDADALLLDEPFAQLDPKSTQQLISLIKRVNGELGVTVLLSCHSCEGIVDLCDRIIFLENGSVIGNDTPKKAAENQMLLRFFPAYTQLLESRPLNVKDAVLQASELREKPFEKAPAPKVSVTAKGITFAYGKRERDILSSLDYEAYKGKINAIIGANGSGKTTLLKALAGIKKCYAGKVRLTGKAAYMPQDVRYLFTADTVAEEIEAEAAEKFGLAEQLNQHPYDLSGGQMQKLALAILSRQDFDILLLDEPTKGLDYENTQSLKAYLKDLAMQGKTVILVSHDIDFVSECADYVAFLADGIIAALGERREILSSLNFYTSSIRRITKPYLKSASSAEDLL